MAQSGTKSHGYGTFRPVSGPAVIVAEPQPGVDTLLTGGPISHPIRSLLDTGTTTVTVTTAQIGGGGGHRTDSGGTGPSASPGQAGSARKRRAGGPVRSIRVVAGLSWTLEGKQTMRLPYRRQIERLFTMSNLVGR